MGRQLVMGLAGAAIAGIPGLGVTAFTGFSIGLTLGGILFPEDLGTQERGKLSDIKIQGATQGTPLPKVFGVDRVAGNVIYTSSVRETVTVTEEGGGGGSGGGPSYTVKDYHYDIDLAISVCEGVITGYRRIWLNQDIIYDSRSGSDVWDKKIDSANVRRYVGSEVQNPDSLLEAEFGVGNVPAYRGTAYVVFESLNLDAYGGNVPNITFEVNAGTCNPKIISEWVCDSLGMDSSDYDFTDVGTSYNFRGFAIPSRTEGRNILDSCAKSFFYDNIEVDGQLIASVRSSTSLATIDDDSLGFSLGREGADTTISYTRIQEVELPRSLIVTYTSESIDFQVWSQQASRQTRYSTQEKSIQLPFVLDDNLAKRIAVTTLYLEWLERERFVIEGDWSFIKFAPGDVVTINTFSGSRLVRIIDIRMGMWGPVRMIVVPEEPSIYTQTVTGAVAAGSTATVGGVDNALVTVLDLNPISEDDAKYIGLYAAAASEANSFTGGKTEFIPKIKSKSGQLLTYPFNLTTQSLMGVCDTILPDGKVGVFDTVSTVDVTLVRGELISKTNDEILAGDNLCIIGHEILQFKTATLIGTNQYRLSNLIRGRRGSEWAVSTHGSSEIFAIVSARGQRFNASNSQIDLDFDWRFYENNRNYSVAPSQTTVSLVGRSRMPWAPCNISGSRDGSNNLTISWFRRARVDNELVDNYDSPLDESTEKYFIEIYSDNTYGVIERTIETSVNSCLYTAAEQVTDFGSTQSTVYCKIYQYSDTISKRGFEARAAV